MRCNRIELCRRGRYIGPVESLGLAVATGNKIVCVRSMDKEYTVDLMSAYWSRCAVKVLHTLKKFRNHTKCSAKFSPVS